MEKKGEIIKVNGLLSNQAAYNPSPIGADDEGNPIFSVRVEDKESDWLNRINKTGRKYDPSCMFYVEKNNEFYPIKNAPVFEGFEDPSGTWIEVGGEKKLLFQAVTADFDSPGGVKIWTNLYVARNIFELSPDNPVAHLPGKDNRFCQSQVGGDIVWLSRPDKGEAFPGRIGFSRLTFEEILDTTSSQMIIKDSKLLKFSITEGPEGESVKMGANQVFPEIIKTEKGEEKEVYRVICHGAVSDKKPVEEEQKDAEDDPFVSTKIHYKAYTGIIDPENLDEVIQLTQIAEAADFSVTKDQVKGQRYEDVVFPGGVVNGYLYVGVGDRAVGKTKIPKI